MTVLNTVKQIFKNLIFQREEKMKEDTTKSFAFKKKFKKQFSMVERQDRRKSLG